MGCYSNTFGITICFATNRTKKLVTGTFIHKFQCTKCLKILLKPHRKVLKTLNQGHTTSLLYRLNILEVMAVSMVTAQPLPFLVTVL